uniref:SFRICE_007993 n=1 Tax=Spodoptera frugiperda TaxID=7108 RepID=A0A2H1WM65_SPOFR
MSRSLRDVLLLRSAAGRASVASVAGLLRAVRGLSPRRDTARVRIPAAITISHAHTRTVSQCGCKHSRSSRHIPRSAR